MRIRLRSLLVVIVCLLTLPVRAEYVIKFSHVVSPETPKGKAADLFAQLVNKRLAGVVRVEVFPSSRLYNDSQVLEAIGQANGETGIMAAPSLSKFVAFSRTLQAFDLPFLFDDIEDVHRLTDSPLMQQMVAPLERKGLKALAVWDNGMKIFSTSGDKPLRVATADFQGKKFRIQSSKIHEAMIHELGGTPLKMLFKEVYTALGQGVVDGQENTWSNIYSKNFHQVQDWISVSNHSYLGYLVVISAGFWRELPADIRGELAAIMREATVASRRFAQEADTRDRTRVERAGYAKVVDLTPEEKATWVRATARVKKQFRRQIGKQLLADIDSLLAR